MMILEPAAGSEIDTSQAGSNLNCDSAVQRFTVKGPLLACTRLVLAKTFIVRVSFMFRPEIFVQ